MRYPKLLKPDGTEAIKLPSGNIVDVPRHAPNSRRGRASRYWIRMVRNPSLIRTACQLSRRFASLGYSSRTAGLACGLIPFEENSEQNSGRRMKSNCHRRKRNFLKTFIVKPVTARVAGMFSVGKAQITSGQNPNCAATILLGPLKEKWLHAALECGLPLSSFLIVEWSLEK